MGKGELDPWGSDTVKDYSRLLSEFGIEPVAPLLPRFKKLSPHLSRGIDFGQRDLSRVLDAIDGNKPYAVMSGIKPSGDYHLGTKMTADDIIYFQSLSKRATAYYSIADVEAYSDNGLSFRETEKTAVRHVADILALGLDPDRAVVYFQSQEIRVMRLSSIFSRAVTMNMLKAIYGERPIGLYMAALVQAGDILMPQLQELGGPKPVLVPVGADQDPHIRLARDLAARYHDEFGFISPSAVYHKLMLSLAGDAKMSKRSETTLLTLSDTPSAASKKILSAFTGGRDTVEEQREKGGRPEICPVYDLYRFHFAHDDEHLQRVFHECTKGIRLCGDCKQEAASLVKSFLVDQQKRREAMTSDAKELLARSAKHLASAGR